MSKPWEVIEFAPYLRVRWRIPAAACAVAFTLTLAASLVLPKRYTAKVVISIDPPSGTDARMATAVSPVYLESLKGYERVAASDNLFARAIEKFHLKQRDSSEAIETLKHRILKISKIRETRILEISATLSNAEVAHQLAEYIAQETVAANQSESVAADRSRAENVERQLFEARLHLKDMTKELVSSSSNAMIEALQTRNDADAELLTKLRLELAEAEAEAAEYGVNSGNQDGFARDRVRAANARAGALKASAGRFESEIALNQATIDKASSHRQLAESELNMAQSEYAAISNRLLDQQATIGTGGERLQIIDPGIVPQNPTFPNIGLNLALATACALGVSIVFVALSFSYERRRLHESMFR